MSEENQAQPAKEVSGRNWAFLLALAVLSGGCLMERASLALIIPSIIVLGLLCTPYLLPLRGAKRD